MRLVVVSHPCVPSGVARCAQQRAPVHGWVRRPGGRGEGGWTRCSRRWPSPSTEARAFSSWATCPARETLAARANEMGVRERIIWRVYVPHDAITAVYGEMDVLVVPSKTVSNWKEQFGRVVVEALACGVPVIASDSGELPRMIGQTGGGWTFPEEQPEALASVLRHVGDSPSEAGSRAIAGRRAVERLFGLNTVADRFAAIVESVALRTPGGLPLSRQ